MDTTRCFVGLKLEPPADGIVRRVLEKLRLQMPKVRWSRPEQLHITIKFLGELDNRELPAVCAAIRTACSDVEPFPATLGELGAFPKNKPPRVVWAGVEEGAGQLTKIYEHLDQSLATLGIPQDGKAYRPHLTLGRVNRGADQDQLSSLMLRMQADTNSQFEVNEILLIASVKDRGEMIYEAIDTVELGGQNGPQA